MNDIDNLQERVNKLEERNRDLLEVVQALVERTSDFTCPLEHDEKFDTRHCVCGVWIEGFRDRMKREDAAARAANKVKKTMRKR